MPLLSVLQLGKSTERTNTRPVVWCGVHLIVTKWVWLTIQLMFWIELLDSQEEGSSFLTPIILSISVHQRLMQSWVQWSLDAEKMLRFANQDHPAHSLIFQHPCIFLPYSIQTYLTKVCAHRWNYRTWIYERHPSTTSKRGRMHMSGTKIRQKIV